MPPVKILVVTPHYYPEGFSITSICEAWAKQGHDVLVVTNKPNYGFGRILPEYAHVNDEVIQGVRVHRCSCFPRTDRRISIISNYLSFYLTSSHYLSRLQEEFDVVYSFSLSPIVAVSGANKYKKKHHVHHVLHCLDLWPESVLITEAMKESSLGYKILFHWSKAIYSKADEILVSSPSFESYFRDVLGLEDAKISLCYQPPYWVAPAGPDYEYKTSRNLVYAGNLGSIQLVENLVNAFALLKPSEATLQIIGAGSRQKEILSLIKEKHLEDRVVFRGRMPRKETVRFYGNCDGIVVSLKKEGFVGKTIPNKLNSSLSYGKPIFACLGGDGEELLKNAGGGFFSKGESPEELAQAVREFFSLSDEQRREMGAKNKAFYEEHLSFDKTVADITSTLEKHKKR